MGIYTFAAIERRVKLFDIEAEDYDTAMAYAEQEVGLIDMDRNMDDYELNFEFESGPVEA